MIQINKKRMKMKEEEAEIPIFTDKDRRIHLLW